VPPLHSGGRNVISLKKYRTTLFEAYGAVMKEYVAVPDSLQKKYLDLSYEYAKTLRPKPTKRKS
jgi:hypothetical protein